MSKEATASLGKVCLHLTDSTFQFMFSTRIKVSHLLFSKTNQEMTILFAPVLTSYPFKWCNCCLEYYFVLTLSMMIQHPLLQLKEHWIHIGINTISLCNMFWVWVKLCRYKVWVVLTNSGNHLWSQITQLQEKGYAVTQENKLAAWS